MRYAFAAIMCAIAIWQAYYVVRFERRWRRQVAEYQEQARIADLPDDEFVAWAQANRGESL